MTGAVIALLADDNIDPTTGHGPEWGKAAPVALLVIALLGVSLFFLIKSMNSQLRKVPASFDTEVVTGDGAAASDAAAGEAEPVTAPTDSAGIEPDDPQDRATPHP